MPHRSALLLLLGLALSTPAAHAAEPTKVTGVDEGDMLKLRAGPGLGYSVIVGLPNGTELINRGCDRVGSTPWCAVSLKVAPRLKGYVSGHYLTGEN